MTNELTPANVLSAFGTLNQYSLPMGNVERQCLRFYCTATVHYVKITEQRMLGSEVV